MTDCVEVNVNRVIIFVTERNDQAEASIIMMISEVLYYVIITVLLLIIVIGLVF